MTSIHQTLTSDLLLFLMMEIPSLRMILVESKLLTLNTKTFQLQGTGFVLENAGNITSIAFSKNDNSLWLSGGEGVEQLDIRSGNVLNSFSWCGEQFRSSDILFTLLDPDQGSSF
ncbi:Uncharacterised protein [Cedecea neteri]|uniref:Uncharacterized protein n=1 Tax=Cedecea neteri TaxID=158822 RepID=A0A2X3JF08_9ENTR|nr:Uncharacterised protein [Cedecea neteri]